MKKTKYPKWSRLLIAALVLVTLLMTAPAAVLAQDINNTVTNCCPDVCKLQVNIVIPDCVQPAPPEDGCPCDVMCNYYEGNPCVYVYEGETFWVNAVIARPDNMADPIENVYAAICLEGGFRPAFTVEEAVMIDGPNATLVDCCPVQGPFTLNGCFDVKDIWWKVRCLDAGPVYITVNAWVGEENDNFDPKSIVIEDGRCLGDSDTIVVKQIERPIEYPSLEVEIIECPEEPVMPGDIYGIKARVWNRTDEQIDCVWAYIDICGPAELTNGNPFFWYAGNIRANSSVEVAWMVRCTGNEILGADSLDLVPFNVSGDVKITVDAWYWGQTKYNDTKADSCCVHQIVPAEFAATLTSSVEKVGTDCNNCFDVTLDISNLSKYIPIEEVVAQLYIEGAAHINNSALVPLNTIPCNGNTSYTWQICCDGPGLVYLWANVTGFDHLFNQQVCFETRPVTVSQEYPLMVTVQEPWDYSKFSVGQAFDFTYRVTNVQDDGDELDGIWVGLDLRDAHCVALASPVVQVVPDPITGIQPFTINAAPFDQCPGVYEAYLDCMMDCCWADITWRLQCTCSGMCDLSGDFPQPTITTVTVESVPTDGGIFGGCGDCVPLCPDDIVGYAYVGERSNNFCGEGWYKLEPGVEPLVDPWNATIRHGGAGGYRAILYDEEYYTGGTVPWPNSSYYYDPMHVTIEYDADTDVATMVICNTVYGDDPVVLSDVVPGVAGRIVMTAKTSSNEYGIVKVKDVIMNGIPAACCDKIYAQGYGESRDLRYLVIDCISGDFLIEFDLVFAWDGATADEGPALQIDFENNPDIDTEDCFFTGDYDSVRVHQMDPPCLAASIDAYEGAFSIGNFECMTSVKRSSDAAVAVGEYFTVVVPVANTGEATAEDVCVSLAANGPAVLVSGDLTVCLGDIPCHGAAKAVWEFQCIGEGAMGFTIGSLIGSDANTGLPINGNCIDTGCAIYVDQIPLTVEVIQPANCTEFIEGDAFSVKARICNNSTLGISLDDVYAALSWYGPGDMALAFGQANPVSLDELSPGECAEATWQVYCCKAGDVTFKIDVWNDCDPYLDISSCPVTIHQFEPGRINAHILSPKLNDYDECREFCEYEAYIATGQEFAVTAKFYNSGDRPFWFEEFGLLALDDGDIQINGGPYVNWPDPANPYRLMPRESVVVSWDVLCTEAGETDLKVYVEGSDDMNGQDSDYSMVKIMQYPAAHLIVDILDYPTDEVVTGTDFSVTARVSNIGEADAWEVKTTLSVEPAGSVRLSAADATGSYTKSLGNLIGHGVFEADEATWVLNCKEACNSTITVTATGYDEYGYEVFQVCDTTVVGSENPGTYQRTCCELQLAGNPGAPIPSRFIEPDSVTVKQVVGSGGQDPIEEPGDGCVEIQLQAGWNLVSIPWYVPAGDRAPEDLLADILENLDSVYAYDACDLEFLAYNPDPEVPDFLTEVRDGPGYWVLMDAPDVLVVCDPPAGGTVPPTYSVDCTGYNLIGPRIGEDPMLVSEWLSGLDVAAVLGYNPDTDTFFIVRSTDMVEPGQGYWVFFRSPGTRAF